MKKYKEVLQKSMAKYVRNLRGSLSQEEMAEALHVSTRAYGDLERGEHFFSGMTLIFLLLFIDGIDQDSQDDQGKKNDKEIRKFLRMLREAIQELEEKEKSEG